jgi:dTDP-glucose 4,6-dehydratase
VSFREGLEKTADWYLENEKWVSAVICGNYMDYYNEPVQ